MKTKFANPESVLRNWHIVDAQGMTLGRMCTKIASILKGKHKPMYTPHIDSGDFVVVVNAQGVKLSGEKASKKLYWTHSGYVGSIKSISFDKQMEKDPVDVVTHAVKGMLPKGPLGRKIFSKLKVYKDASHPHIAQSPKPLSVN